MWSQAVVWDVDQAMKESSGEQPWVWGRLEILLESPGPVGLWELYVAQEVCGLGLQLGGCSMGQPRLAPGGQPVSPLHPPGSSPISWPSFKVRNSIPGRLLGLQAWPPQRLLTRLHVP